MIELFEQTTPSNISCSFIAAASKTELADHVYAWATVAFSASWVVAASLLA